MKYMWVSVVDKKGKNIGMILIGGEDIFTVEFCEHQIPQNLMDDVAATPVNKFLTKEEMEKYVKTERVPDEYQ